MEAYWVAATKGKIGEVYNIGGNKTISVEQFLKELLRQSKKKSKRLDKNLLRPQDINVQIPSSYKFMKDTGWKPKILFKDSVAKLLNECRNFYR